MNCQEAAELMHRYLDHDLSAAENEELTQHLSGCPSCSVFFEKLKRISAELENLPRIMPPYSLVDSILPQLDLLQQQSMPSKPFKNHNSFARTYLAAAGAIAASLLLGIGISLLSNQQKSMNIADEMISPKAGDTINRTMAKADIADKSKQLNGPTEQPNAISSSTSIEQQLGTPRDGQDGTKQNGTLRKGNIQDPSPSSKITASSDSLRNKISVNTAAPQAQPAETAAGTNKLMKPKSIVNSQELSSEDGNLVGKIDHLHVIVQDAASKEILFTSAVELNAEDTIEFIGWQDNRLLKFTLETNGVKSTYTIDIQAKTETKS